MNNYGEWIKLSDRLPELNRTVLLFEPDTPNQKIHIGLLTTDYDYVYHKDEDEDEVVVELSEDGCTMDLEQFTHWMPLPDHPK